MAFKQQLNWLILALICPLIAGAPSSMTKRDASCPKEKLSIERGNFELSNNYLEGSLLRYRCQEGYYPSVQSLLCQNGLWINPNTGKKKKVECKKITCPNPRVLENGEVAPYKERYYVNDTTTYTCHSDYKFRGSEERVCKPNGKWSGSTPICGRDSDNCPDPGVPAGSSRTGNTFNFGDKVRYHCDSQLTLIGSPVRECQDGGQWSGTEPQCYASFTYDTAEEAAEAFGSSLKTNLMDSDQDEVKDQYGKKITLDAGGKLDIYIAVDASDSIDKEDFDRSKEIIKTLINQISYYDVSPNYEILIFATEVTRIIAMKDFKRNDKFARNLGKVFEDLDKFDFDKDKGTRTGTNIAKAYYNILDSIGIEKQNDKNFLETQHIIIMFTDGQANTGGSPLPKVTEIKNLVLQGKPEREKNLDLYVFGFGDVKQDEVNGMISQKDGEKHFFKLPDLKKVQETLDAMIDEGTSVELCGIHQTLDESEKRRAYPWLAQIYVARSSQSSNCMGSLVTSSFILTAAHCFKDGDTASKISVQLQKGSVVKVDKFIVHPDYKIDAKKDKGIKEYYENDIALIQLSKPVLMNNKLRPICIPCTKQTNGALKLPDSEGTCKKHEEILLSNELVEAAFTSKMVKDKDIPRNIKRITIKRGKYRDACFQDALKAEGVNVTDVREVVSDNFLCSGGTEPTTDDVACKGESGGATHVLKKGRTIQVGIVSWGVKNLCTDKKPDPSSIDESRDYHTNLFSEKMQSFLKEHLGDAKKGSPLTFF